MGQSSQHTCTIVAGEILLLGAHFCVNPYLIPVIHPLGGKWGYM